MSSCTRASAGISCPGHCRLTSGCPPSGRWPSIWRSASSPCRMPMSSWRRRATSTRRRSGATTSARGAPLTGGGPAACPAAAEPEQKTYFLDLVTNSIDRAYFPFTVWARLMRETLLERDKALLQAAPYNGAEELRRAISDYLRQFRGMNVDSGQIHRRRRYGVSVFAADPAAGPGEVLRRGGPRIQQNCGNLPQPSGGPAAGGTG